jgi:hypothetical protein
MTWDGHSRVELVSDWLPMWEIGQVGVAREGCEMVVAVDGEETAAVIVLAGLAARC